MPEASTVVIFCVATLAYLAIPGPAVLYILTRSVTQGRTAGLVSVAGIHVGTTMHVIAAAAGVSALLASSAAAYSVVKWAGAAYLVVLGVRKLLVARRAPVDVDAPELAIAGQPLAAVFRQGVIVNVLNPKTAVFFLAFLPQFAETATQSFFFGGLLIALGVCSDGCYALLGAAFGRVLRRRARRIEGLSGLVYVGLGARMAA